jgi:peptide/nickel transport system permease protein
MARFATGRLLESLIVLGAMSFAVYILIGLMPGDPIDLMISGNPRMTSEDAARLRALYGLDRPLVERYTTWLLSALQGDFGYSRSYSQPVLDILVPRLGNTLLLMGVSLAVTLTIAIPLGIFAAVRPYSAADSAVNLFCFAGISMPSFWFALLCIILFAVKLGWLPAGGMETVGGSGMLDRLQHLVMPVAVLTVTNLGSFTRHMRASMIQTLRQDYIRTARAKGVGTSRLLVGHALQNALLPLITIVGLSFGNLFSGALITEIMFSWLGMGKLMYDAILGNDYNLALVGLLFATAATLIGNFLADIGQVAIDPRVTFASREATQ